MKKHFDQVEPDQLVINDVSAGRAAQRYLEAKEAEKYAKEEKEKAEAEMLMAVGNAEWASIVGEYVVERKERFTRAHHRKDSRSVTFFCKKVG